MMAEMDPTAWIPTYQSGVDIVTNVFILAATKSKPKLQYNLILQRNQSFLL